VKSVKAQVTILHAYKSVKLPNHNVCQEEMPSLWSSCVVFCELYAVSVLYIYSVHPIYTDDSLLHLTLILCFQLNILQVMCLPYVNIIWHSNLCTCDTSTANKNTFRFSTEDGM
jgi:hypothetical protein